MDELFQYSWGMEEDFYQNPATWPDVKSWRKMWSLEAQIAKETHFSLNVYNMLLPDFDRKVFHPKNERLSHQVPLNMNDSQGYFGGWYV